MYFYQTNEPLQEYKCEWAFNGVEMILHEQKL